MRPYILKLKTMIKTYKTINAVNLRTSVEMDGKIVSIRFDGGFVKNDGKVVEFGRFSTSDEKLQTAIEKDSAYGKSFICTTLIESPETNVVVTGDTENGSNDNNLVKVPGVTTKQLAIEWLFANKELKLAPTLKVDEVKAEAAKVGVEFIDWK